MLNLLKMKRSIGWRKNVRFDENITLLKSLNSNFLDLCLNGSWVTRIFKSFFWEGLWVWAWLSLGPTFTLRLQLFHKPQYFIIDSNPKISIYLLIFSLSTQSNQLKPIKILISHQKPKFISIQTPNSK